MPHITLDYNIDYLYQVIVDIMYSLWPIIAAALGIAMAGFLLYHIVRAFRQWVD